MADNPRCKRCNASFSNRLAAILHAKSGTCGQFTDRDTHRGS